MKSYLSLLLFLVMSISGYSQIDLEAKPEKKQIEAEPYDSSFSSFSHSLRGISEERKAGVVGQRLTIIEASSFNLSKLDGERVSILEEDLFKNKTFTVRDYKYENYRDILRISNESGEFIFKPNSMDVYVFNGFIDKLKKELIGQKLSPLFDSVTIKSFDGREVAFQSQLPLMVQDVNITKGGAELIFLVVFENGASLKLPFKNTKQPKEQGRFLLSGDDYLGDKLFLNEGEQSSLAEQYPDYIADIRKSIVRVGMTEEEARLAWGMPTSVRENAMGYDLVLIYGDPVNGKYLFFKNKKIARIK